MMIAGARQERLWGLRRLSARAMARDLRGVIIPGPEVARALGLDIEAAGIRIAATPRDANVLVLIGDLPPQLDDPVAVIYAQMVRPRAILMLGTQAPSSLPRADIAAGLSQAELTTAVERLRKALAEGAFAASVADFDAPVLHATIQYVCPMHPEVIDDQPGACPKCGMDLVAREAGGKDGAAGDAPEHGGHHQDHGAHSHGEHNESPHAAHHDSHGDQAHSHCDHGHHSPGQDHEHAGHPHPDHDHGDPEHHPASHEDHEHASHPSSDNGHGEHSGHDHDGMGFMSMVAVTKDLPRSRDGLQMDWLEVPFGPFFPGLPGGLLLTLTLDGDGVASGRAQPLVGSVASSLDEDTDASAFVEQLALATPLAPVSYRLLASRAIEQAAGLEEGGATARARIAALERERIANHLGWLVQLGRQIGFDWLVRRATASQLSVLRADHGQLVALRPAVGALTQRLERTPLLKARLAGIGPLLTSPGLRGPVARAAGCREDARLEDAVYRDLGFETRTEQTGDAWARLRVRLAEIAASLDLIEAIGEATGAAGLQAPRDVGAVSGKGGTSVETPRGRAGLTLTLDHGRVVSAELDTPCSHHIDLVAGLVEQQELGDALVAVGSLDLSPWEVLS